MPITSQNITADRDFPTVAHDANRAAAAGRMVVRRYADTDTGVWTDRDAAVQMLEALGLRWYKPAKGRDHNGKRREARQ